MQRPPLVSLSCLSTNVPYYAGILPGGDSTQPVASGPRRLDALQAHRRLARPFTFDTQGRPHSTLDGQTPDMVYFALRPQREAA